MLEAKAYGGSVELLAMALEGRTFRRALLLLPPEPGLFPVFSPAFERLDLLHHDLGAHAADRVHAAGARPGSARLAHAPFWEGPLDQDLAVLFLPKERELAEWLLAALGRGLAPGRTLFVVGPKQGGIQSSAARMAAAVGPVISRRSARHCVLLEATAEGGATEPWGDLLAARRREFKVQVFGRELTVVSLPGVFSHGRLDAGTSFLLSHWRPEPFRRALDLGAGSGVIGAALALAWPQAQVDLADAHIMAVLAARETLTANGLDPARVFASDGFGGLPHRYDLIVSNPPFHQGLRADNRRAEGFLAEAKDHLEPGGRLVIVTNVFVHYFSLLGERFRDVRVLAEDRRYRVVEARRGSDT